jgi:hypothetical protein
MWQRETILKILAVLAVIWALALGGFFWARSQKPAPEKVTALIVKRPITDLSAEGAALPGGAEADRRRETIAKVTHEVNRLDFKQRRELRNEREIDAFFAKLSLEEKKAFLEDTLPRGFQELMRAINAMEPQRRRNFIEQALRDMEEQDARPEGDPVAGDPELATKIADAGMQAYYESASADVKLELAPVIEKLQERLQSMGGGRR